MKIFYFIAAIIGLCVPYWDIFGFISEHGVNIPLALEHLYRERITSAFVNDFFLTVLVILAFTAHEGWRIGLHISSILACVAGLFFGGASFALPLFLFLREIEREKHLKAS
ncbi:MAG: DUF2834 domain-containing protein [Candidatus Kapaibacterium sp.]|nr:MAG: DUF2834 domain-containing protein [Candidatus Kapabacteria bacterium]